MCNALFGLNLLQSCQEDMTTGNIECILAAVNNLSDSDLKILVNLITDRQNPERAFASSVKIVPRMECPVFHTSAHVVGMVTSMASRHFCAGMRNVVRYSK